MEFDLTLSGVLLLGLVIGLQHALEADHLAAVASIVSGEKSWMRAIRHGAVWGAGHSITLGAVAGTALFLGTTIDPGISNWIEFFVGIMLVGLGAHVLWRLMHARIHFHIHSHADGRAHLHAHSHAGEPLKKGKAHARQPHDHKHAKVSHWRTLFIGLMHGMAGSAALVVLTASQISTPMIGVFYIILFGIGSVVGMAALSAVIAVPLGWTARTLSWANNALQLGVGTATVGLGGYIMYETELYRLFA